MTDEAGFKLIDSISTLMHRNFSHVTSSRWILETERRKD